MPTKTIRIGNIAGGDARTFRVRGDVIPDAAIRHARSIEHRTFGGWSCDDPDAADQIRKILDDATADV